MLRKSILKRSSNRPKSSFGRGNISNDHVVFSTDTSRSIMLCFRQTHHHLDRSYCVFDRHISIDHVVFSTDTSRTIMLCFRQIHRDAKSIHTRASNTPNAREHGLERRPLTRPGTYATQPSATSPLFRDNLHFEHFDKNVNHESRLTLLSKCSKWRLSKKRGLVAHG